MFACIFIPDFSVQAILRFEPELRTRSVAVLTGRPPLEKVVALNEKARQAGIEPGATKARLEAWENLVLRVRSEVQENSAHAALLDCAQTFSPEVEDTSPGTVLLNLAGLEPLLGPLPKIARDLAQQVSHLGLDANLAVAANPDAALLAARGFSGVTLIPEGREAERLGDLPVDILLESFPSSSSFNVEEVARWVETFDRWGIRKLRALAALPEVPVSERLGQQGLRLQKLARGAAARNLRVFEPRLIFAESVELENPIVLLEPLAFLLSRMLEQLCARLRARALAAQELHLHLDLATAPLNACTQTLTRTFTRTLHLPVPMLDTKVFFKLLQLDLQAHPPGAPIVKVYLSADPARPRALQSGLFQPAFPEPEKLELTLARIAGIVGEERVGSAELLDTHREGAFAVRHFAPTEPVPAQLEVELEAKQAGNRKKEMFMSENVNACPAEEKVEEYAKEQMSAVIALRLFRPPLGASVTLREAKPVRLRCLQSENIAGEIVWTAGPWRSSGDWSEQEGWSREEWDIAVSAESSCQFPVPSCQSNERERAPGKGQPATGLVLYRLVQDKLSGNWFVEGMYD